MALAAVAGLAIPVVLHVAGGPGTPQAVQAVGLGTAHPRVPASRHPATVAPTKGAGARTPTRAPATTAPTAKAPTTKPSTKAPSSKAPTTKAPTTKPPAKAPTTKKPTTAGGAATSAALEVLRLTNAARAAHGCRALRWNAALGSAAAAHSADMRDRNYFDHNTLDGRSPFDRIRATGYTYRAAGENIAAGQPTAAAVMNSWMNSPGHRANILNCDYTELGVGVARGGSGYGIYWTQVFGTPR